MAGVARWRDAHGSLLDTANAASPSSVTLESACEELDGLLQQSVREHLISDVPLSVWLSGGLDSSTILHYASQAILLEGEDFLHFVSRTQL